MISFQVEKIEDIKDEIAPLLEEHWKEVAWYQDKIELKPDMEKYISLDESEKVIAFTMRDDGELVGYNVFFVNEHMHYREHLYAVNDVIFIKPEYRHRELSATLIKIAEAYLKVKGVSVVTMHMKPNKPFHSLMKNCGYKQQEFVYSKYIGD